MQKEKSEEKKTRKPSDELEVFDETERKLMKDISGVYERVKNPENDIANLKSNPAQSQPDLALLTNESNVRAVGGAEASGGHRLLKQNTIIGRDRPEMRIGFLDVKEKEVPCCHTLYTDSS